MKEGGGEQGKVEGREPRGSARERKARRMEQMK